MDAACSVVSASSRALVVALTPWIIFDAAKSRVAEHDCDIPEQYLNGRRIAGVEFVAEGDAMTTWGPEAVHMHHLHVARPQSSDERVRDFHLWATHGDLWSTASGRPTYSIRYPEGYCLAHLPARAPYESSVCIDDVRSPRVGTMRVRVVATFSFASDASCKPISQVWLHSPIQKDAPFWTYAVPSREDTLTWWSTQWPYSGRLLDATRYHSHQRRMGTAYLLRGTLVQSGVDVSRWLPMGDVRFPYVRKAKTPSDAHEARRALDRAPRVCKFEGAHAQREDGTSYDAPSRIECAQGHIFHAQDVYTLAKLHAARYDAESEVVYTHDVPWIYLDAGWSEHSKTAPLMAADVNRRASDFAGEHVGTFELMWPFQAIENLRALFSNIFDIMNDGTFAA